MFFTILLKDKQCQQKISPKSYKAEIKILAYPTLSGAVVLIPLCILVIMSHT